MAKKRYSFQEIVQMDQHLRRLAAYETSNGMVKTPKCMDDIIAFQEETNRQFCFFKRMIQNCECTFEELEQMVFYRYGAVPNPNHNLTLTEALDKIDEEFEEEVPDVDFMDAIMASLNNGTLPEGMVVLGAPTAMSFPMPQEEEKEAPRPKRKPASKKPKMTKTPKKKTPTKPTRRKANGKGKNTKRTKNN